MFRWLLKYVPFSLLSMALVCACGGAPSRLPDAGFQVDFGEHRVPGEIGAGETIIAMVTLGNASNYPWSSKPDSKGKGQVNLAYHWLDTRGEMVVLDGLRTALPKDLAPGEVLTLNASIQAPATPGKYILQLSMVQERVAWFHEKGGATLDIPMRVVKAKPPLPEVAKIPVAPPPARKTQNAKGAAIGESMKRADIDVKSARPPHASTVKARSPGARPSELKNGAWSVQVASLRNKSESEKYLGLWRRKGYDPYIVQAEVQGVSWFQVRIGKLKSQAEAERLRLRITQLAEGAQPFVTNRQ